MARKEKRSAISVAFQGKHSSTLEILFLFCLPNTACATGKCPHLVSLCAATAARIGDQAVTVLII